MAIPESSENSIPVQQSFDGLRSSINGLSSLALSGDKKTGHEHGVTTPVLARCHLRQGTTVTKQRQSWVAIFCRGLIRV